jgi:hypothetical protein
MSFRAGLGIIVLTLAGGSTRVALGHEFRRHFHPDREGAAATEYNLIALFQPTGDLDPIRSSQSQLNGALFDRPGGVHHQDRRRIVLGRCGKAARHVLWEPEVGDCEVGVTRDQPSQAGVVNFLIMSGF